MSEINGVQLARLWARAWRDLLKNPPDSKFKDLLESDPFGAAVKFYEECVDKKNGYAPFPDPQQMSLLDLEEYSHAVANLKNMPPEQLERIIKKNKEVLWIMSKFLTPQQVLVALLKGDLEIY